VSAVYPRIIVCHIAFDTIMYCKHDVVEKLSVDYITKRSLEANSKFVNIYVDMGVDGATLPKLGDDEEDPLLADNNVNDWNAGRDISDSTV